MMKNTIMEGVMNHQWQVHRQITPTPTGMHRWDKVYQRLYQWGSQQLPSPPINPQPRTTQEKK